MPQIIDLKYQTQTQFGSPHKLGLPRGSPDDRQTGSQFSEYNLLVMPPKNIGIEQELASVLDNKSRIHDTETQAENDKEALSISQIIQQDLDSMITDAENGEEVGPNIAIDL